LHPAQRRHGVRVRRLRSAVAQQQAERRPPRRPAGRIPWSRDSRRRTSTPPPRIRRACTTRTSAAGTTTRPTATPSGRSCAHSPKYAASPANRAFLQRAVRYLVSEAGIRQIIGIGIPAAGNVHETASQIAPATRVAYADNDPVVHVHANALLTGTATTSIVLADLRDPHAILTHPKLTALIDLTQPVALLVAVVHFLTDQDNPARSMTCGGPRGPWFACPGVSPQVWKSVTQGNQVAGGDTR
jgi:S-adenosyl methyltransferase